MDASYVKLCDRDILAHMIDRFMLALKAHDPTSMPFAPNMKFTENGQQLSPGQGIWKTAGETKFKHSAFDLQGCVSVTEAVITESGVDIPFGARLKFEPPGPGVEPSQAQPITELEIIAVRPGAYPMSSDTLALAASSGEMWEQLITFSQRPARAQLATIVDNYFVHFPAGACNFAPHCQRLENGFAMGACMLGLSCAASGTGSNARPRISVIDVETGLAVGFLAGGGYTGFLMFRVRGGQVEGLHTILAAASTPGW